VGNNAYYQACLEQCIFDALAVTAEGDAVMYRGYPVPSDAEWVECLQETHDDGEDLQNPYECLARYEFRLAKRGIKTVLGRFVEELRERATGAGVPPERFADVVTLMAIAR